MLIAPFAGVVSENDRKLRHQLITSGSNRFKNHGPIDRRALDRLDGCIIDIHCMADDDALIASVGYNIPEVT